MARRVALITGAGHGIGRATALALSKAKDLFQVVATDVDADALARLKAENQDVRTEVMDVSKEEDVEIVVGGVPHVEGNLDVLVNCMGIMPMGPLERMPEEWHKKCFDVNYWGTAHCTKIALPYLRESPTGRAHLVNVSSAFGITAIPFSDAYAASKFAVEGLTEALALTLPQLGVDVSLVEPAAVTKTGQLSSLNLSLRSEVPNPGDGSAALDPDDIISHFSPGVVMDDFKQVEQYDDIYTQMLQKYFPALEHALADPEQGAQSPEEVAEVIKEVILGKPKPKLRNLTGVLAKRLASVKLADLEGNRSLSHVQDLLEQILRVRRDFLGRTDDK